MTATISFRGVTVLAICFIGVPHAAADSSPPSRGPDVNLVQPRTVRLPEVESSEAVEGATSFETALANGSGAGGLEAANHFESYHGLASGKSCGCRRGNGCCPPAKKKAKPNPCATSHKILFYDNDFSYLRNPCYQGNCFGDCLKLMPVGECGRFGTLDIGGQLRLRYHHEIGMGQDRALGNARFQDTTHDFLLTRLRLYGNWQVNDWLRGYAEGIHANIGADDLYNPRIIERNSADLLNAFVDVTLVDGLTVRVGRQELLYGIQRFVSPLDWANTRRTFEGIKVLYKSGDWAIDGFFTNFVPVDPFQFDKANYDISFYGLWSTYSGFQNSALDMFYLGFDNETAAFSIHTVGASLRGKDEDILWDLTAAGQFGDAPGLTGTDQGASMTTCGLGTPWLAEYLPWTPTVWLYWDYATGNPSPNVVGTNNQFNQLFPLAHKYLGFIDAVQRSNIESPNVLVTMKPHQKFNVLLWYYNFQSNGGSPVPAIGGAHPQNTNKFFGNEFDTIIRYAHSARTNILFGYSHLWRGSKILNPEDASFFYTQWELNF